MFDPEGSLNSPFGMRVDFSGRTMPLWVRHISGLSEAEGWGRWSDARLGPSARICSCRSLPRNAVLRLRLSVVNAKCNPVVVTVGARSLALTASTEPREFVIEADQDASTEVIDIRPSMSFCPKDLGWSEDPRRLGVALHTLEITSRSESLST